VPLNETLQSLGVNIHGVFPVCQSAVNSCVAGCSGFWRRKDTLLLSFQINENSRKFLQKSFDLRSVTCLRSGLILWVLRFSHQWCFGFKHFWMWHSVVGLVVSGISLDCNAFIFKGQVFTPWKWRHCNPSEHFGCIVSHHRRFESSK